MSSGGAATGGSSAASGMGVGGTGAGGAGAGGTTAVGGTGTAGAGMGGGPSGGTGAGGSGGSAPTGGVGGSPVVPPLDCGGKGAVIENHGPPANRVNYVIVGDGYTEAELETTYLEHIQTYMTKRFSDPIGQVYLRYRNFVNICAIKVPSTPICGDSTFGCCGNDSSRLASCNSQAVNMAIMQNLPATFEVDWRAAVLNGDSWWNTGASLMLWSGGNRDAAGAALHEGGHGHNLLSDEYGNCEQSRVSREATYGVNVSLMNGNSGGKWEGWINYNQTPGTGMQGFFACDGGGTWRPSSNSMMNSLFGTNPNTSYNPVSREKIVMDIWRIVTTPWDSVVPAAGAATNPATLTVNVIDPAVINVDWTVDGTTQTNAGTSLSLAGLAPGTHSISAKAYDNAGQDLVRHVPGSTWGRQNWTRSVQTVSWTVTLP